MRSINDSLLLIGGPRAIIVTHFFDPTFYTWLAVPRYPARVLTPSHTLKSAQTKGSVVVFWFAAQHDTAQRPLRGASTVLRPMILAVLSLYSDFCVGQTALLAPTTPMRYVYRSVRLSCDPHSVPLLR